MHHKRCSTNNEGTEHGSIRRPKTSTLWFATALATLLILALASPANAHWEGTQKALRIDQGFDPGFNTQKCVFSQVTSDKACYRRNNDTFRVYDWTEDDMRVGVEWRADYGDWGPPPSPRAGLCWHTMHTGYYSNWTGVCDLNFWEGRKVIFRVGRCDGDAYPCGKPGRGSGWKDWSAWTSSTT